MEESGSGRAKALFVNELISKHLQKKLCLSLRNDDRSKLDEEDDDDDKSVEVGRH